ncbi:MAG TPA: 3-dehydroquinate synthase, partial [Candidatus Acidoferrales bacterium]|nr:3-dehydroquinate synthase [Candidatus Acidoferrales bacterium]
MPTLTVNLGDRSYPIIVDSGVLPRAGEFIKQIGLRGKVAVVTNPTVAQLYLDVTCESLARTGFQATPVLVPDGESHKNLQSLSTLYDRLIAERFERSACIVALGGGVIGDLA